jgi:gliding motility-associated-like protein
MRKIYFFLVAFSCLIFCHAYGQSAGDYVAAANMEWNSSNWKISDGAGGFTSTGLAAPASTKNVYIATGATVTVVTTAAVCNNLTIMGILTPTAAITISGVTDVEGTLTMGAGAITCSTAAIAAATTINGILTMGTGALTTYGTTNINGTVNWPAAGAFNANGDLNVNGTITMPNGSGALTTTKNVTIGTTGVIKGNTTANGSVQTLNFNGTAPIITINGQLGAAAAGPAGTYAVGESLRVYAGGTTETFTGTGKVFVARFQTPSASANTNQNIIIDIDFNIDDYAAAVTGFSLQAAASSSTGTKILTINAGKTVKLWYAAAPFHNTSNVVGNTATYATMTYNVNGILDVSNAIFNFLTTAGTTSSGLIMNIGSTGVLKLGANVHMLRALSTQTAQINVAAGGVVDGSSVALNLTSGSANGTTTADNVWFTLAPGAIFKRLVTVGVATPLWIGPSNTNYNPVTVTPATTSVFTAGVATGNAPTGLNTAKALNRTWTITPDVPSATNITFGYNGTALGGGDANTNCDPTAAMKLWYNNGISWDLLTPTAVAPTAGTQNDKTVTFTGISSFPTFALVNDFTASNVATLSALTASTGSLSPVFSPGINAYAFAVNSSSIAITPTLTDATASVTVNGNAVASGAASISIPLNVGSNAISVVVTAQDGSTINTYTLTVTRNSNNANLGNLALSTGVLSPAFAATTLAYTAEVANSANTITITPTVADATATVTVNGTAVTSGNPSGNIALNVGVNNIPVIVTAQDGVTIVTYTIAITRDLSSNASLSALALSDGVLTPAFSASTNVYTASVANGVSSLTITPTAADPTATITVNGTTVVTGSASSGISLSVGDNTITTIVKAQDGTTINTYTLTVTRAQSSNADLASIALSNGTLNPVFSAATIAYTASVSNLTTSITVTPAVADVNTTLSVNGNTITSGTPSGSILLAKGNNTITVKVTAQDGTIKTYSIVVNRAYSSDALLSALSLSNGTLNPVFSPPTNSYSVSVPIAIASITVSPTVDDVNASVTVNGTAVTSGSASGSIVLNSGSNTVTVAVKAEDGTINNYSINVVKTSASANANLSSLVLSSGSLSPTFAPGTSIYTVAIPNGTNIVTLTPTLADATASVKVNGTTVTSGAPSGSIALSVGSNIVHVVTLAQDGITTINYTITFNRAASANANLSSIALSSGSLSPVFAAATTNYTVAIPNATSTVTLTPTLADATAAIAVNGTALGNGNTSGPIPLNVGSNIVHVVTLAQDGSTTINYTITFNRAASSVATLSAIALSSGSLSPGFLPGTTNYTVAIPNATNAITLTPTLTDATATIKVNGTAVSNGTASGSIPLSVGANVVHVVNLAQDGVSTVNYTITFNRAASSNANLSAIALSSGTLSPAFTSGTLSYTASVPNLVTSVTLMPTLADATATVTVNGNAVNSGSASGSMALNVGNNTITVLVTAADGTKQTYTILVNRALTLQTITFAAIPAVSYGTADFSIAATSTNSTIPLNYASSNTNVATINSTGILHVVGAGSTTITVAQAGNATFGAATPVTQSLTVNPVALTISANNSNKAYLDPIPALTVNYSGFVNNETSAVLTTLPVVTTTATALSNVGTYPITVAGAASTNYTITYVPAVLNITVASRVFTFAAIPDQTYGNADFPAGALVNTNDPIIYTSSNTAVATIVNGNIHIVGAGTVSITANIAATGNYIAQQASQQLLVNRATQTIVFNTIPAQQIGNVFLTNAVSTTGLQIVLTSSNQLVAVTFGLDIKSIGSGTATITASQAGNANYLPASATQVVTVQGLTADQVSVHTGLSPNGDGINDFLTIDGIKDFPDNKLTIVNRNGVKEFQISGYNNADKVFDGHASNGNMMTMGTYFYVLEFNDNGDNKRKVGYIILKNQ